MKFFNRVLILALLLFSACGNGQNNHKEMKHKYTNALINESSPYLLQHAHNPVNWHAWSAATLELAQKENKPLLISIGYSSCHWCHVMEHQSFEDEEVARYMNEHFICIKVDREEHPDVDQIYMNAVQLITGSGGWPLNCFALPDGRPFYGGTYFPRKQWMDVLKQVAHLYENEYSRVLSYAQNLEKGIQKSEQVIKIADMGDVKENDLDRILNNWVNHLDDEEGGPDRTPKFPLPNNYRFLMRYAYKTEDSIIDEHIKLTLNKMAFGGIYDQLGGGFARYSTDRHWKVPHFEKMLYDNAQLISLYSEAYARYGDETYKRVAEESLEFIQREMTSKEGLFYSALDADSDGEEGKYYVWTKGEIDSILGEDAALFADFYQMDKTGLWENGNYILMRHDNPSVLAEKYDLTVEQLLSTIKKNKALLMVEREKRVKPGLDDKSILSWNAMMVSALCDAGALLGKREYIDTAVSVMNRLLDKMQKPDNSLWHTYKEGKAKINAFLDDYAFTITALIRLYQTTGQREYLFKAKELAAYSIDKFYDDHSGMFFYTNRDDKVLVARKTEIFDNVIPSSNSQMARNLFYLSDYFDDEQYRKISKQMLLNVQDKFSQYGSSLSNWGLLMMDFLGPVKEVVICGKNAQVLGAVLQQNYLPNVIWAQSRKADNELPLLRNRFVPGKTLIYVCIGQRCELPVDNAQAAMEIIR